MALVQFGTVVTDIKGKIAGSYFAGSLGGARLQAIGGTGRTKGVTGGNIGARITSSGQTIGACLLYVIRSWKAVSAVNKAAWLAAAPNWPTVNKFGVPTKPSAYHSYVHVNYQRAANNRSLLAIPPTLDVSVLPQVFTITTLSSVSVIINISPAVPVGYQCDIAVTRPLSAGLKPSASLFRQINWIQAGVSGAINTTTEYEESYGGPITGSTVWISATLSSLLTGVKTSAYVLGQVVT